MKTIPNNSRYCLDEQGNIYSTNYKRTGKTKIMKPAAGRDGYLRTMLIGDDGNYSAKKIHRLMAITYIGPSNGLEVNHIDCNKLNNSITNLEYVTRSENIKHAYRNNLIVPKKGELNGKSKLTGQQVIEIRQFVSNFKGRYYGRKELAKKYSVSECAIKEIVARRRNTWSEY